MKKKILVVEDDRHQRVLLDMELQRAGYDVVCVAGGREAVEKVTSEPIDLVVLDIGMPDMDGLEAMQKILDIERKLPVVINTAYPSFKDDFQSWSADAYVVKSGDLSELLEEIATALERGGSPEAGDEEGT
ncbi:MAG: response regulator [Armatimonadota bacterium]